MAETEVLDNSSSPTTETQDESEEKKIKVKEVVNGVKSDSYSGDAHCRYSIAKLSNEKVSLQRKLERVEQRLEKAQDDKDGLSLLNQKLKIWAEKMQRATRNNQGVPYIRDIKEVCTTIKAEMQREDFQICFKFLAKSNIPCFYHIRDGMENLTKQCTRVLENESSYKTTYVEEMRQLLGRMIGSTNAILDLYFEE